MRYNRRRNNQSESETPRKRRLKTKPLLIIIAILFAFNVLWFISWLLPTGAKPSKDEEIASVNGHPIMREEWMTAMEQEIGHEMLLRLVNNEVMKEAAKKHDIQVSDEEIDLELALIHSVDNQAYAGLNPDSVREKLRSMIILEKVLTKDVVIEEEEIKKSYDENNSLYNIETAYKTEVIVVSSKKEADQTLRELNEGSSFTILAKERSIDAGSANLGGDLGYINEETDNIDAAIIQVATQLQEGNVSEVIELANGNFAVVRVSDVLDGRSFTLEEVSDYIKRELALEQLPESVTPEAFWKEFKVKWFYGDS